MYSCHDGDAITTCHSVGCLGCTQYCAWTSPRLENLSRERLRTPCLCAALCVSTFLPLMRDCSRGEKAGSHYLGLHLVASRGEEKVPQAQGTQPNTIHKRYVVILRYSIYFDRKALLGLEACVRWTGRETADCNSRARPQSPNCGISSDHASSVCSASVLAASAAFPSARGAPCPSPGSTLAPIAAEPCPTGSPIAAVSAAK